ncbi:hypothetical protein Tco_1333486, partial [Tanacetum coccineum]
FIPTKSLFNSFQQLFLDPAKEDNKSGQGEATNTNSTNRLNIVSSSINTVSSSFTTMDPGRERSQRNEFESVFGQDKDANGNNIYRMFTPVNAAGSSCDNLGGSIPVNAATLTNDDLPTDPLMPEDTVNLLNTGIFSDAYDDEDVGAEPDLNNLETTMNVSPIPTTKIYKDHPKNQIIGDINSSTQTRRMTKISEEHAVNPKKVTQALIYPSWIEMDVKSVFLYGTIEDEEDSGCQPPGFRIPIIPDKVYKVKYVDDIIFGYGVDGVGVFQVTPKVSHLHAVKRVFRNLKGQPKLGLWYPRDSPFDLEAFLDSDYARAMVANSTTEAEYVAAANCCGQVLWIQNQMLDYGFNFMNTKICIDNKSTICNVKNPMFHSKTKHIEIRHHFIKDSYEKRLIQVIKIHTDHNVADLLTKAFDVGRFPYLTASIGMLNP